MSLLVLSSTNPEFSFIIQKNPETIQTTRKPFSRELRRGRVLGWFSKMDNSQFSLLFRDAETETSFTDSGDFEYLDKTRYSSPYAPVQMIDKGLRTAWLGHEKDVDGYRATVSTLIEIPTRLWSRIHMPAPYEVEFKVVRNNYVKVTISAPKVSQVLNLMNLICILAVMTTDDMYIPMDKPVIFKYLKSLNEVDAPYYLRHLFLARTMNNPGIFKAAMEEGLVNTDRMIFNWGNTQQHRLSALKDGLRLEKSEVRDRLIDIGCGEMSHSLKLTVNYSQIIGYDADPELVAINAAKIAKRELTNLSCVNMDVNAGNVEEIFPLLEESDIIISEVLEHMSKEAAAKLLAKVLTSEAGTVVVTVPCKDFNIHYNLKDDEVRHPDHKWEPTRQEFIEFIQSTPLVGRTVEIKAVGDSVDGIPATLMAIFSGVAK